MQLVRNKLNYLYNDVASNSTKLSLLKSQIQLFSSNPCQFQKCNGIVKETGSLQFFRLWS